MTDASLSVDVVVVGAGNAGLCAALAAAEAGASVLVLEKAPKKLRGGNTAYTGFYRFAYSGLEELRSICPVDDATAERMAVAPYPPAAFLADLVEPSGGKADVELMSVLAEQSFPTMRWLIDHGMKWEVSWEGAREHDGKLGWQPGTVVRPTEMGHGILKSLYAAVGRSGGEILYEAAMTDVTRNDRGGVDRVLVKTPNGMERVRAGAVVLAAGGFEANAEMRAKYLGRGWDMAKVRGSRFNTGEVLSAALRLGAATSGQWSGCHATMVHASAPPVEMGEEVLFPLAYPFGILVDVNGERFTDEGENFYLHTYVRLGKEIMELPGGVAYQIFDAKTKHLRKGEGASELAYAVPHHSADTLHDLAVAAGIRNPEQFEANVAKYNEAILPGTFDPSRLDGTRTTGLAIEKTNWALPIDTPPFQAFPVECGITLTYGGLRCDGDGQVLDTADGVIQGLYAVGELAGTFYTNYAGGSGLTKGAVFGRLAGAHAAHVALASHVSIH